MLLTYHSHANHFPDEALKQWKSNTNKQRRWCLPPVMGTPWASHAGDAPRMGARSSLSVRRAARPSRPAGTGSNKSTRGRGQRPSRRLRQVYRRVKSGPKGKLRKCRHSVHCVSDEQLWASWGVSTCGPLTTWGGSLGRAGCDMESQRSDPRWGLQTHPRGVCWAPGSERSELSSKSSRAAAASGAGESPQSSFTVSPGKKVRRGRPGHRCPCGGAAGTAGTSAVLGWWCMEPAGRCQVLSRVLSRRGLPAAAGGLGTTALSGPGRGQQASDGRIPACDGRTAGPARGDTPAGTGGGTVALW